MRICKGDTVLVISGLNRDIRGKIIKAYPKYDKVLTKDTNCIRKHVANSTAEHNASSGGIVTQEAPIYMPNIMLVDEDDIPARVDYRFDEDDEEVRISRHTGKDI